ncbi:MAG TPA: DUF3048 domain-containing protein [Actinomycetota bacterium]|nr:DUF3048 domain-containing protein [Actinomycetota bacterium]
MRRHLVVLLLLVGMLAAACRQEPTPVRRPRTPPPSPSPTPEPVLCPLTGLEPPPGVDINRPAIGVKIDNHPMARPQTGLELADIVYEELVEGGITRFLAMFHCGDAADLGPTRSARAVDPDLLVQYAPALFAYSGGSPNVLAKVAGTAGVIDLKHGNNSSAYSRRRGRSAPHNLYTSTDRIRSLPLAAGVVGPPKTGLVFDRSLAASPASPVTPASPPSPPAGAPAQPAPAGNKVSFSYSGAGSAVSYAYDAAGRRYLRSFAGQPHNSASGAQLSAVNVVVLKVQVDRRGKSPEILVNGGGEATVLRLGQAIQGSWNRPALTDQTKLVDAAGQPIKLAPGNVWINLVPNDRPVTVE